MNGEYGLIKLVGVDGVVSRSNLANYISIDWIGGQYFLYKISENPTTLWGIKGKEFFPIENCNIRSDGLDIVIEFFCPFKKCDLIIGRNSFNWFQVILNGKATETESFYSFIKIPNIMGGKHSVKIDFSVTKLLTNYRHINSAQNFQ
ncbi:MAG: hypothetical protein U5R49_06615 [Deltaproteobacteria bacterium]|nr:hypothetical protein [Deltaproteobacteria bacterium]